MWRLWTRGWGPRDWWLWFKADGFPMWVAWHLPHRIVMWCFYRVGGHATSGQFGCESPSELLFFTAADRWEIAHVATSTHPPTGATVPVLRIVAQDGGQQGSGSPDAA